MNMYLQSDKEISFVLQKILYKKLWNLIELGVVHKLHHTFHRLFSSPLEKWFEKWSIFQGVMRGDGPSPKITKKYIFL